MNEIFLAEKIKEMDFEQLVDILQDFKIKEHFAYEELKELVEDAS